jgi:hypothetical protein
MAAWKGELKVVRVSLTYAHEAFAVYSSKNWAISDGKQHQAEDQDRKTG